MAVNSTLGRLILCLFSISLLVSCSPGPQSLLEEVKGLDSWEQKEKILIRLIEEDEDPVVTVKALSYLVMGYLDVDQPEKAQILYLELTRRVHSSDQEMLTAASDTAADLHRYYLERLDYFRASGYLKDQIFYMESAGEKVDKELQLLIDLYLDICRYQEAIETYNKWFDLYGRHSPVLAEKIKDKIMERANPTQENT